MTHHTEAERATFSVSVLYDAANYTDVVAESPEAAAIAAEEKFGIVSLCHQCTDDIGLGDIVGAHVYKDGQLVLDTTSEGRITQELADANARIAELTLELQAARRAPAAPVPQGLREAAQAVVERWDTPLWKDVPATAVYIADLRAALAAAPQPPESAQVQLPEPVGVAFTFEAEEGGPVSSQITSNPSLMPMGWTRIFTEQQVRQLLAQKG